MSKHANRNDNDADHHLYEIYDHGRSNTYKYGICGNPLNSNGSSPRANIQVKEANRLVGWIRFFARILLIGIPGRLEAKRIEDEHIEDYRIKYGSKPPGNT